MEVRVHRERPEPWSVKKQRITHAWILPFWALEWCCEWVAFGLDHWAFLEVLDYLEILSVLIAVIFYFSESGDRIKQKHYQAWQVINTAQGKGGSGGRGEALHELNADGVALVGVDVSGAFLQGVDLRRARLVRCNFNAADLRDSQLDFADFTDADLQAANFRHSDLRNADFQGANLDDADFSGADLSGAKLSGATLANTDLTRATLTDLRWHDILDLKGANIFGVTNAPAGFVAWALAHGAIQIESDP
jgi:hypothetical protein